MLIDFRPFKNCLAHKAFDPKNSKGRKNSALGNTGIPDDDNIYIDVMDPFQIDIGKIVNSKAHRRLKDKSQVFCFPNNPHVRTRMLHTNEVAMTAIVIAEILGLNVKLCRAIAEGHDIGHTPYGHAGEEFISKITGKTFRHEVMSLVVAQHIERKTEGLNLCFETLQGILHHSRGKGSLNTAVNLPLEYAVVMLADKIAYTFSDINDALRYEYLKESDLPSIVSDLGSRQRERMTGCIFSLIKESAEGGEISFSESEVAKKFEAIRQWMFENVYSKVNWSLQENILGRIYDFFQKSPDLEGCDPAILLALLTDKEVNGLTTLMLSSLNLRIEHLDDFGIMEIAPHIRGKNIDFARPDLDWAK